MNKFKSMKTISKVFRLVNLLFWSVVAVVMMIVVYGQWSQYGSYTFFSFMASLVIYGGWAAIFAWGVDSFICWISKKVSNE